jgi:hypothetical protein
MNVSLNSFLLLVWFQIAHFICDYTGLSTRWMISAKKHGRPVFPIFCHALINGVGYALGALTLREWQFALFVLIFETVSHTIFDTLKGRLTVWVPLTEDKTKFPYWIIMGLDQLCHQIVIALLLLISIK